MQLLNAKKTTFFTYGNEAFGDVCLYFLLILLTILNGKLFLILNIKNCVYLVLFVCFML